MRDFGLRVGLAQEIYIPVQTALMNDGIAREAGGIKNRAIQVAFLRLGPRVHDRLYLRARQHR